MAFPVSHLANHAVPIRKDGELGVAKPCGQEGPRGHLFHFKGQFDGGLPLHNFSLVQAAAEFDNLEP